MLQERLLAGHNEAVMASTLHTSARRVERNALQLQCCGYGAVVCCLLQPAVGTDSGGRRTQRFHRTRCGRVERWR